MTCPACQAGLVDSEDYGCQCPTIGCLALRDAAANLVAEYFLTVASPNEALIDCADLLSWLDPHDTLAVEQSDEVEEDVRLYLRAHATEWCEHCNGTGQAWDECAAFDDLQRRDHCRDCDGTGTLPAKFPKLVVGTARTIVRGALPIVCVSCGSYVDETALDCSCGAEFIQAPASALEGSLRASVRTNEILRDAAATCERLRKTVLAVHEPENDERRGVA